MRTKAPYRGARRTDAGVAVFDCSVDESAGRRIHGDLYVGDVVDERGVRLVPDGRHHRRAGGGDDDGVTNGHAISPG